MSTYTVETDSVAVEVTVTVAESVSTTVREDGSSTTDVNVVKVVAGKTPPHSGVE
jgi:hypothetical protein